MSGRFFVAYWFFTFVKLYCSAPKIRSDQSQNCNIVVAKTDFKTNRGNVVAFASAVSTYASVEATFAIGESGKPIGKLFTVDVGGKWRYDFVRFSDITTFRHGSLLTSG